MSLYMEDIVHFMTEAFFFHQFFIHQSEVCFQEWIQLIVDLWGGAEGDQISGCQISFFLTFSQA